MVEEEELKKRDEGRDGMVDEHGRDQETQPPL